MTFFRDFSTFFENECVDKYCDLESDIFGELKNTFGRAQSSAFSSVNSLGGRAVCLFAIPVHIVNIFAKPTIYAEYTLFFGGGVTALCVAKIALSLWNVFPGHDSKLLADVKVLNTLKKYWRLVFCVIVSPFGQIAQIVKAVFGVFHPGAYFKEMPKGNIADRNFWRGDYFICDAKDLEKDPIEVLHEFAKEFALRCQEVQVRFSGQSGVDAGGLARAFVNALFEALSAPAQLDLSKQVITRLNDQKRQALDDLGVVLGGLLRRNRDEEQALLIGAELLHPSLLKGVFAFTSDELNQGFIDLSIDRRTEIWRAAELDEVNGYTSKLLATASIFRGWDEEADIEFTAELVEVLDGLYLTCLRDKNGKSIFTKDENNEFVIPAVGMKKVLKDNFGEIRQVLEESVSDNLSSVETFYFLAKGMYKQHENDWQEWQREGVEVNKVRIEGKFDKEQVLKKFQYINLSPDMKKAIKDWINTLNDDELKTLVRKMTGSASFNNETRLTFQGVLGAEGDLNQLAFPHTCSSLIEISSNASVEDVIIELKSMIFPHHGNNINANLQFNVM